MAFIDTIYKATISINFALNYDGRGARCFVLENYI